MIQQRALALSLGCVATFLASAQADTKKPVPKKTPPPIQGAVQMAGGEGKLGETYTIGKPIPLNFCLTGAEFTVERVNIGDQSHFPKAEEKLLVLNFSIHNPNKTEFSYDWGTLRFTVVDAENVNHEYVGQVGDKGTRKRLAIDLKPAQKVWGYTVIKVPAAGVIPKLIVEPTSGGEVERYDLRTAVKGLAAPFADPKDKSGATALTEVPAEIGKFYPMMGLDVKLVKTEYIAGPLGDREAEEGKQYFVATVTIQNQTAAGAAYDTGNLVPAIVTGDDEKTDWNQILLKTSRNEQAGGELNPGEAYTVRVAFAISRDMKVKTFSFSEPGSRVYAYALAAK